MRRHFGRTAATAENAHIRMSADYGHMGQSRCKRQDRILVLQKHDAPFGDALGHAPSADNRSASDRCRMVEEPFANMERKTRCTMSSRRCRGTRFRLNSRVQAAREIGLPVELFAVFLVEAVDRPPFVECVAAPIRHHEARIVPIVLQGFGSEIVVLARVNGRNLIVSAHHGARMARLDCEFESKKVRFPRRQIDPFGVRDEPPRLLIVERVCLTVEITFALWMPAPRFRPSCRPAYGSSPAYSKFRPLRGSRARSIPPGKHDIEVLGMRFRADHRAAFPCEFRIKVEASARSRGNAVEPWSWPLPSGLVHRALHRFRATRGTPRLRDACHVTGSRETRRADPLAREAASVRAASAIFSSSVMAARAAERARLRDNLVSIQGLAGRRCPAQRPPSLSSCHHREHHRSGRFREFFHINADPATR